MQERGRKIGKKYRKKENLAFVKVYGGFLCYGDGLRLRVTARFSFSGEASATVRLQVVFLNEG